MKPRVITLLSTSLILAVACEQKAAFDFDALEVSYQLYLTPAATVVAKNTDGDTNRRVFILDLTGRVINETIVRNEPFQVTNVRGKDIEVTFHINRGEDLAHFRPWLTAHKTVELGDYTLRNTYQLIPLSFDRREWQADSITVDRRTKTISLFSSKHLLNRLPINSLYIHKRRIVAVDYEKNVVLTFVIEPTLSQQCLSAIVYRGN